jgi:hypothetical protein
MKRKTQTRKLSFMSPPGSVTGLGVTADTLSPAVRFEAPAVPSPGDSVPGGCHSRGLSQSKSPHRPPFPAERYANGKQTTPQPLSHEVRAKIRAVNQFVIAGDWDGGAGGDGEQAC